MDFIYSLKQFDNLWSFNKYVFSIGTYEGSSFKQLLFPLIKNVHTLIFAIDEKYNLMNN